LDKIQWEDFYLLGYQSHESIKAKLSNWPKGSSLGRPRPIGVWLILLWRWTRHTRLRPLRILNEI
jgi:hypothetical protein